MMGIRKRRLLHGVGLNDADYMTRIQEVVDDKYITVWTCPFYKTWKSMITRCYSDHYFLNKPAYRNAMVCQEWLTFSNFKSWMEKQDYVGKDLDKDILVKGNTVYSPETCIFVPRKINNFILDCYNRRGDYMIGVYWRADRGKYQAYCADPFTGKTKNLGHFTSELEAHLVWKRKKHEHACALADSDYCTDPRLADILRTRYLGDFTND